MAAIEANNDTYDLQKRIEKFLLMSLVAAVDVHSSVVHKKCVLYLSFNKKWNESIEILENSPATY